ncbi:MAG: CinA family protein [Acidiferrobacteraceae bacterium]
MAHADTISPLIGALARALAAEGLSLAVAESCTGGGLSYHLTSLAGSSQWFERGFVTYSNAAKTELLGVPKTLLDAHGAVSGEAALAMAEGVLRRTPARVSAAITGIAGPGGARPGKPVGTVFIAVARDQDLRVRRHEFVGDRDGVRRQAIEHAVRALIALLKMPAGA